MNYFCSCRYPIGVTVGTVGYKASFRAGIWKEDGGLFGLYDSSYGDTWIDQENFQDEDTVMFSPELNGNEKVRF